MIKSDFFDQKINVFILPKKEGQKKRSTSCFSPNEFESSSIGTKSMINDDLPRLKSPMRHN